MAWNLAFRVFTLSCMKKVTVIGIMGKTQGVKMAAKRMYFDPSKAIRELGFPQTPVETTIRNALEWFKANGYR